MEELYLIVQAVNREVKELSMIAAQEQATDRESIQLFANFLRARKRLRETIDDRNRSW